MYNHSRFSGKKIFIHTGRYLTGTAAYFQRLGAEVYAPGNALKSPFFIRPVKRLSLKGFITDKGACSRPGEQKIDLFYTGSSKYDNPAFIQALSNTGVPGLIVPGIDPGLYGTFPGASFLDALITISGILIFYKESEHFCLKNSIRKNLVSFDELNRIKAAFIQAIYDNLLDNVQYRRLYTGDFTLITARLGGALLFGKDQPSGGPKMFPGLHGLSGYFTKDELINIITQILDSEADKSWRAGLEHIVLPCFFDSDFFKAFNILNESGKISFIQNSLQKKINWFHAFEHFKKSSFHTRVMNLDDMAWTPGRDFKESIKSSIGFLLNMGTNFMVD